MMKRVLIIIVLVNILLYLAGEDTKSMDYYQQLYVNYRLNSYLPGDCLAKGKLKLKFEHTDARFVVQNEITSLFLLRNSFVMLDIGLAAKLIDLKQKRKEQYYKKVGESFIIHDKGKLFSFQQLGLRVFDEKSLSIEYEKDIVTNGNSLELFYHLDDSYIIAAGSPPNPDSGHSSFFINRNYYKGREYIWEHHIKAGAPKPALTDDKRIILAFPNKVVSCDFQGNLKTLYKGSFGAVSVSVGEDDTIYLLSIKSNDYYLTALSSEGSRRWERKLEIETYPTQPPIVSPNAMVYVIEKKKIIALRKGVKLWEYQLTKNSSRRGGKSQLATVLSDDTVLISDNNRVVYLNEFGEPIWIYRDDDKLPFVTQPILDENGHVVVATNQHIVVIK